MTDGGKHGSKYVSEIQQIHQKANTNLEKDLKKS